MIINTGTPHYKKSLQKALIDIMSADEIYLEDVMMHCENLPTFRKELSSVLDITICDIHEMFPIMKEFDKAGKQG